MREQVFYSFCFVTIFMKHCDCQERQPKIISLHVSRAVLKRIKAFLSKNCKTKELSHLPQHTTGMKKIRHGHFPVLSLFAF